ncbi:hypothetical protein BH11PLA1_BH11PLA1_19990 [soil metagenome]
MKSRPHNAPFAGRPPAELLADLTRAAAGWRLLGIRVRHWQPKSAPASLRELAAGWETLSRGERESAWRAGSVWWSDLLPRLIAANRDDAAAGAMAITAERGLVNLTPLLVDALAHASAPRAEAAETALVELAVDCCRAGVRADGAARAAAGVMIQELGRALEHVDKHRRMRIAGAWLRLIGAFPAALGAARAALTWLDDANHPAVMVLRARLRQEPGTLALPAAWALLLEPAFTAAAAARLVTLRPADPRMWLATECRAHLTPQRRALLRRAGRHVARSALREHPLRGIFEIEMDERIAA